MSKFSHFVRGAFIILPLTSVFADADPTGIAPLGLSDATNIQESAAPFALETPIETKQVPVAAPLVENPVKAFTGKVRGKRVRMRSNADLESRIVKELDKNDLITVVGEKGDFYAIEAPVNSKAYVFRSFILDNVVEGNRVNIRLHPDTEAPVLGQLNNGDKIQGSICQENPKWLEIALPSSVHFYVAKEFVENIGGPELKGQIEKRKNSALELLDNAAVMTRVELRKSFPEMDIERIQHSYKKVVSDFADFPEYAEQAKDALAALQDAYVQKRIAFLESKISGDQASEPANLIKEELVALDSIDAKTEVKATEKMLLWEPIEEALYLDWAALHEDRSMQEFYEEQKTMASTISGVLEPYAAPIKNKPGSHILKDKDLPVAYVYSTKINLENCVGKKVTLRGIERPNNHFAFPAYFVISQE